MILQIQLPHKLEKYTLGVYATLANSSVMQEVDKSMILASVCVDYNKVVEEDFLPLSVQYIEKSYAVGKIPQGFLKREGKPSEEEVLCSRLIDRSLRPLFPKDFPHPVVITILVLSYNKKSDLEVDALNCASIALYLSDIKLESEHILSSTRIINKDSKIIESSNYLEALSSKSNIFVSGLYKDISMIEMQGDNMPLDELISSLKLAKKSISKNNSIYEQIFSEYKKPKVEYVKKDLGIKPSVLKKLKQSYFDTINNSLNFLAKSESNKLLESIALTLCEDLKIQKNVATNYVSMITKDILRDKILNTSIRIDGRALKSIRDISILVNPLPYAHGSALFTRGQTQALVSCTLGGLNDAQTIESFKPSKEDKKRVMLHYNFPPFSVGEADTIGASSRRESGHGNLALKSIKSTIEKPAPTIRLVSEILQSNGSSSMASVCGASLALKVANIPTKNLVAGIAMGLVYKNKTSFAILSDILGIEDHYGDMDFKITGSRDGFNALQLDIKIKSLSFSVLELALKQAREGLDHILDIMEQVEITPNFDVLPQSLELSVALNKIAEIIGSGGKTIREIIQKFDVSVDINKENGKITLSSSSKENINNAKSFILDIVNKKPFKPRLEGIKIGDIFQGSIKKIAEFGMFIEIKPELDGLLRFSVKINPKDYNVGDKLEVRILNIINNKIELEL